MDDLPHLEEQLKQSFEAMHQMVDFLSTPSFLREPEETPEEKAEIDRMLLDAEVAFMHRQSDERAYYERYWAEHGRPWEKAQLRERVDWPKEGF